MTERQVMRGADPYIQDDATMNPEEMPERIVGGNSW